VRSDQPVWMAKTCSQLVQGIVDVFVPTIACGEQTSSNRWRTDFLTARSRIQLRCEPHLRYILQRLVAVSNSVIRSAAPRQSAVGDAPLERAADDLQALLNQGLVLVQDGHPHSGGQQGLRDAHAIVPAPTTAAESMAGPVALASSGSLPVCRAAKCRWILFRAPACPGTRQRRLFAPQAGSEGFIQAGADALENQPRRHHLRPDARDRFPPHSRKSLCELRHRELVGSVRVFSDRLPNATAGARRPPFARPEKPRRSGPVQGSAVSTVEAVSRSATR